MRIGVTSIFNGSAFGSGLPQVAFFIAKALVESGHSVEFILPGDSDSWFADCNSLKSTIPSVKLIPGTQIVKYDLVIEVVWNLPHDVRLQLANKTAMFYHYPPIFYDIENSVYPISTMVKSFDNISCVWTWDHYSKDDLNYLKLLSRRPVFTCPLLWDSSFVDSFVNEEQVPKYSSTGDPSIIICESNESNTSHCTVPLTILSEIYRKNNSQKWCVLNAEKITTREYFKNNVLKNLHIPDADVSGNYLRRIRLPDLRRESNIILSHQRFRPIKYMLIDALWLGIPLIHNCEMIRSISGGEYYYELNRISQALEKWELIKTVKENNKLDVTRQQILELFGPSKFKSTVSRLISETFDAKPIVPIVRKSLRVAFFDMWVDFNPTHNLFLHLLKHNGYDVENDQTSPNLIIFGPFGTQNTEPKWASVPKIFFTGENQAPVKRVDVVMNIGFRYDINTNYIRLPIWMFELNWYKEDRTKYVNPDPFDTSAITSTSLSKRDKFCCFVASNGGCTERNTLFHMMNRYKNVDSAGALYNSVPRIEGGPGGSKGQLKKVDFYKQYKFVLTAENGESPGYVTEKLLHAKLAGCVPIYWGDPEVAKEFNKDAFINVRNYKSFDELLDAIRELDTNDDLWNKIASQTLFNDTDLNKRKIYLAEVAKAIVGCVNGTYTKPSSFTAISKVADVAPRPLAESPKLSNEIVNQINRLSPVVHKSRWNLSTTSNIIQINFEKFTPYKVQQIATSHKEVIVSACHSGVVKSIIRLISSAEYPVIVYTWRLSFKETQELEEAGAALLIPFDTNWSPMWDTFWNIENRTYKAVACILANTALPKQTNVLYIDDRYEIANNISKIFKEIDDKDVYLMRHRDMKLEKWSHPIFTYGLNLKAQERQADMFSSGVFGFKTESRYKALIFQYLSGCCIKQLVEGEQFKQYSDISSGHRGEESILSLFALRNGLDGEYCDVLIDIVSADSAKARGALFYCHNGSPKEIRRILDGIDSSYVVNLSHRADRLERFWAENSFLKGLTAREEAVYGNKLELTKEIAELFKHNDFKWKKGVMGCALSHYNIWKRLRAAKAGNCLVLEDDAVLDKKFPLKWQELSASIPGDADVIFIGGVLPPNKSVIPQITEPVNQHFARVKKHNLFGGTPRRYFHFCTYSYIITRTGVEKMCRLIEQRGIFTSIDHMMVNHGDDLLNIFFTTPLLAKCFQDSDPAYINADFNNFNRVDKFDSEIWNNVECFTQDEVQLILTGKSSVDKQRIVYFESHQPEQALESEWLEELIGKPLEWVPVDANIPDGSTVLIFYQHTTPVSVIEGWINRHMGLRCILYHASDEACTSNISIYNHPGVKAVIRNYWRPDAVSSKVFHLPLGYAKGRRFNGTNTAISKRPTAWSFAGAGDRKGRLEIIEHLKKTVSNNAVHITPSFGTDKNLPSESYLGMLRNSQFIPCLTGFHNVESYRFYEALEAGCLPLVPLDKIESYKNILSGSVNPPLLGISDWMTAGQVINKLSSRVEVLDKVQTDMMNWWSGYKQYLRRRLSDIIN